jgi:hypothetical protein
LYRTAGALPPGRPLSPGDNSDRDSGCCGPPGRHWRRLGFGPLRRRSPFGEPSGGAVNLARARPARCTEALARATRKVARRRAPGAALVIFATTWSSPAGPPGGQPSWRVDLAHLVMGFPSCERAACQASPYVASFDPASGGPSCTSWRDAAAFEDHMLRAALLVFALASLPDCGGFETCDTGSLRCHGTEVQACYPHDWMTIVDCASTGQVCSTKETACIDAASP